MPEYVNTATGEIVQSVPARTWDTTTAPRRAYRRKSTAYRHAPDDVTVALFVYSVGVTAALMLAYM